MANAAFSASCTCQKMTASTLTGAVILGERLLGVKGRSLDTYVDYSSHIVDDGNGKREKIYALPFIRSQREIIAPWHKRNVLINSSAVLPLSGAEASL
jgi:hypothetical protein